MAVGLKVISPRVFSGRQSLPTPQAGYLIIEDSRLALLETKIVRSKNTN
jgi:hypothetical protein